KESGELSFDSFWERTLHTGFLDKTGKYDFKTETPEPDWDGALKALGNRTEGKGGELELNLVPDHKLLDGRFRNNPWLQEVPDPATKVCWDNPALVSPATAARLGVKREEVVELRAGDRSIRVPVYVLPGHADDTVTLALGYGRTGSEKIASGAGVNAFLLQ